MVAAKETPLLRSHLQIHFNSNVTIFYMDSQKDQSKNGTSNVLVYPKNQQNACKISIDF